MLDVRRNILVFILPLFLFFQTGCVHQRIQGRTVSQFSTMDSLRSGGYGGWVKYRSIAGEGDFGIGTVDRLDGEMIALDGRFYRIGSDGAVNLISPETLSPFATVTFFRPDMEVITGHFKDYYSFSAFLDNLLPDKEAIYAVRLEGFFPLMKARSVPAQNKPFPALDDALKGQTVFLLENVSGTMAGFRFPSSCRGVNAPGYHFHFISADKRSGGHVLEFALGSGKVYVSRIYGLKLKLPPAK